MVGNHTTWLFGKQIVPHQPHPFSRGDRLVGLPAIERLPVPVQVDEHVLDPPVTHGKRICHAVPNGAYGE